MKKANSRGDVSQCLSKEVRCVHLYLVNELTCVLKKVNRKVGV